MISARLVRVSNYLFDIESRYARSTIKISRMTLPFALHLVVCCPFSISFFQQNSLLSQPIATFDFQLEKKL